MKLAVVLGLAALACASASACKTKTDVYLESHGDVDRTHVLPDRTPPPRNGPHQEFTR